MDRITRSVAVVAATAALAVGAVAAPASAAKKPPVKISGTVTNKGVATVTDGAVSIAADDFYFKKTFLKAQPGSVQVTVENTGNAPHTFTVDGQDVDVQLASGDEKTVTVAVTAGTPVVFYCKFHRGSGMQGALFTKKTTAASSTSSGSSSGSGAGGSSYGY